MIQTYKEYLEEHQAQIRRQWLDQQTEDFTTVCQDAEELINQCKDAEVDHHMQRRIIDACKVLDHAKVRYPEYIKNLEILKVKFAVHGFKLDGNLMQSLQTGAPNLWEEAGRPTDDWAKKAQQKALENLDLRNLVDEVRRATKMRHDGEPDAQRVGVEIVKTINKVRHSASEAMLADLKELHQTICIQIFDLPEDQALKAWKGNFHGQS